MKEPTENLIQVETITINGEEFIIEEIERLEYSGEWVSGGYLVTRKKDGALRTFFGYPIESDIKKFFDIK